MSKRVKDIILGTLVYAGIGQGIAGFLIYAYIYPALEKRKRKRI